MLNEYLQMTVVRGLMVFAGAGKTVVALALASRAEDSYGC